MSRPKILFICSACPFGETYGTGLRIRHVARLLKSVGDVTFAVAAAKPWSDEQLERTRAEFNVGLSINLRSTKPRGFDLVRRELDPTFLNTHSLGVDPADAAAVWRLVDQSDVVWVHSIKVANALGRYVWQRTVLDLDDYPSRFHQTVAQNSSSRLERANRWWRSRVWRRREMRCLERFDLLTVCTEADRAHFGGGDRVQVVPNGFSEHPEQRRMPALDRPRLGMIGHFEYRLNTDALSWFTTHVWPLVRAKLPAAELRLVGRGSEKFADSAHQVAGLGYVDDPAAEMATWAGLIAPTRMGGGTSVKVAEALARRIPVVATTHGARGYDITNGRNMLVADEPASYADACVRLMTDLELGRRVADEGLRLFNSRYSWKAIGGAVERAVTACIARSGHAVPAHEPSSVTVRQGALVH